MKARSRQRWMWAVLVAAGLAAGLTAVSASDATVADAARLGDAAAVRALLKSGADVNAAQADGMTALHWAAQKGDAALAGMLLAAGANARATTRLGGYTPMHLASQAGHAKVVAALLASGAGADVTTATGASPLMLAACAGSVETASRLVENGADVNASETTNGQRTPRSGQTTCPRRAPGKTYRPGDGAAGRALAPFRARDRPCLPGDDPASADAPAHRQCCIGRHDRCARSDSLVAAARLRRARAMPSRNTPKPPRAGNEGSGGNAVCERSRMRVLLAVAASALYARNLLTFLTAFWDKEAKTPNLKPEDEIVQGVALTRGGAVVHPQFADKPAAAA